MPARSRQMGLPPWYDRLPEDKARRFNVVLRLAEERFLLVGVRQQVF
jgi:hypothetical protein